ncbi:MAG: hypothetical protein V3T23_07845 [Nitrososphaerales archaeon]
MEYHIHYAKWFLCDWDKVWKFVVEYTETQDDGAMRSDRVLVAVNL